MVWRGGEGPARLQAVCVGGWFVVAAIVLPVLLPAAVYVRVVIRYSPCHAREYDRAAMYA